MKTTKKQRERAKRIKELKAGRWCWACVSYPKSLKEPPCSDKCGFFTVKPRFRPRRIGRKEVVP
jgi:hypothetical protein